MKIPLGFLILVLYGIIQTSASPFKLPDVIIGDPYKDKNDILGPPLSDEEMKGSWNLKENDPENAILGHPMSDTEMWGSRRDPISDSGFFEGDIMIESRDELYQILQGDPMGQFSPMSNPTMLWPEGVIPYTISADFSGYERSVIGKAMQEYHQRTYIRFIPKTNQADYVHIFKGDDCSSAVGRWGGKQSLSLGNGCVYFGTVLHEFMHAAGFWHEQSRNDRDNYVTILWENIKDANKRNFGKKTSFDEMGLPYDYSSIMHYSSRAFSKNGLPTIINKTNRVELGQGDGFSELDVRSLNLMYASLGSKQVVTQPQPKTCTDDIPICSVIASFGTCKTDADFMRQYCRKTCRFCGK